MTPFGAAGCVRPEAFGAAKVIDTAAAFLEHLLTIPDAPLLDELDDVEHREATAPRPEGSRAWSRPGNQTLFAGYLISLMMLNIGRYSEMIIPPTHTPITTISSGSINEVNASTVASTSWS